MLEVLGWQDVSTSSETDEALSKQYISPRSERALIAKRSKREVPSHGLARIIHVSPTQTHPEIDAAIVKVPNIKRVAVETALRHGWRQFTPEATLSSCESSVAILNGYIRESYKLEDIKQAIKGVCEVWEKVDETARLAQARLSLLLKKCDWAALTEECEFHNLPLFESLENDSDQENPIHPTLKKTAKHLIQLVMKTCSISSERISVEKGLNGRVVIEIEPSADKYMRWILTNSDLSWPGLNALVSEQIGVSPTMKRTSRSIHTAYDLIDLLGAMLTDG